MSSIIYNRAFELELTHNFYVYVDAPLNNEFKVNRDMAVVPTKECEALMRRGRMRFVPTIRGFTTFYQAYIDGANTQQPLVKLSDNSEFVFSMHMDVAAIDLFLNVSNLNVGSKTYGPGKFFMLNQKVITGTGAAPVTLTLGATLANSLRGPIFGYTFKPSQVATSADIIIKFNDTNATALTITGVPFNDITNTFSAEIDLSKQPKGFYTLKAYISGSTNPLDELDSNDFYVDGDLLGKNTFGITRVIYADISKLYQTTGGATKFYTFDYAFAARATTWRYYIVCENLVINNFELYVLKSGGPVFKASYPPTGSPFSQVNGLPDQNIMINGKDTVIFQSVSPITFSEAPPKGYELWKDPASGPDERLLANLPGANVLGPDSDQWGPVQTPPVINGGISEIYVFI